ncbi:hypothetical protein [Legionella fallonii]|uniref:Uncharacterized protein n=1 Tax=Legionella fallonii LLAP-10 TaxID=1212491 RepID=A0A098G609_9GAMM|nr:hypothetical protein [Legionella fallonii]CEG57943.1 protein of unknown function [Legionella fallonii LLAP-10]
MAESIKNLSINLNIHAIEEFLHLAQTKGMKRKAALDELIFYFMNHLNNNMLLLNSSEKAVTDIKEICDAKDFTTHSNFLAALTIVCYQSVSYVNLRHITEHDYCPAQIVAAFHHELLNLPNHPIIFKAYLNQLAQIPNEKRAVFLFCIKTFVPEMLIVGNFSSNEELSVLSSLINACSIPTSFTFSDCNQEKMSPEGIDVFLSCIAKAERLVLDEINMNAWTVEFFLRFVQAVKANNALHSLSLANTQLNKCCMDSVKFNAILELITLPQITEVNLQANNLDSLPQATFKILKKTIIHAGVKPLGLELTIEKKGTAGNNGLFAQSVTGIDLLQGTMSEYGIAP